MLIVRAAVYAFYPPYSFPAAAWRESLNWVCAIVLLLIIRFGERLPFRSVGIGRASIQSSLAWGGVIAVVCAVLAFGIVALTHYTGGSSGAALAKLPLWLITLIVFRAGVLEELFYRGYAIERLEALGLNRFWAGTIPLLIFARCALDRRLGQHRHRARARCRAYSLLSLAPRSRRQYDRPFHGRLHRQRPPAAVLTDGR